MYERQKEVNKIIFDLAKKHGVKVIATNDVHFVEEEHGEAHDRLICLSTGKDLDDPTRMHYTKQEWLKTPEEMGRIFSDHPEVLENTQEIVDKVESYSIDSDAIMPKFPIPEEFGTEEEYRQKFTEEDLFNEFTRDEHGNIVMSQEEAEKKVKKLGGYDRLYRIKLEADYLAELTWKGAHQRYGEELTEEQVEFLNSISIDPESDMYDILDAVEDYLTLHCLDENYEPNEEGWMCYDIIDYLTALDE